MTRSAGRAPGLLRADLTGTWRGPSKFFIWRHGNRRCAPTQLEGCSPQTNRYDPIMTCQPMGIPRQGAPGRIFHTEEDITLLYGRGGDGGGFFHSEDMKVTDSAHEILPGGARTQARRLQGRLS